MGADDGSPMRDELSVRQIARNGVTYFVTWRLHPRQPPLAPAERTLIVDALKHFDGERYLLGAYVVMDDHVHLVVQPARDHQLSTILHTWKSFTAHALQVANLREGALWQHGSHGRIIRDEDALSATWAYVLGNPKRRWGDSQPYVWAGVGELRM